MTIKLLENKFGQLCTKLEYATEEQAKELMDWMPDLYGDPRYLDPIVGYEADCEWPEPRIFKMTDGDIKDDDNVSLRAALYALFETGYVDDKRLGRTFELPDGTTIEV